ncbi:MAG TPA: methyltransferase domain-containing protein [Anaerolineae bacterium]|nr:methyltransferase domain-containing protein [Anaerolineae bacterium]
MIILSHYQANTLLEAHRSGRPTFVVSLDLGLTTTEVTLTPDRLILPGAVLAWNEIEEITRHTTACFIVENHHAEMIRGYSDLTGRVYGLMPTEAAPTMLISGLPMHRIKGTDPHTDTLAKIKAIAPITGQVLDTCTGLGYTAIEAAKTAERVITIELDPTAQAMARCNPWSRSLFDNPKIEQIIGDAFEVVPSFEDGAFSCILHDPPMLNLAGELYSGEFYRDCWRVLRRNGKLFHYIGDPDSKSGARTTKGVVRRLQEAGFTRVVPKSQAFGVAAYK